MWHRVEGVAEFIYLGTLISDDNSVEKEIQRRILAGNRSYFAAISLFRSQHLSRDTKIVLYKTLIRPVVLYGVYRVLVGKPEGRRPLGRPRHRWVDNIMMNLQEVGRGYMDWNGLAQDRDRWRKLVSAVMNIRVP